MNVQFGEGTTQYGTGVQIDLTGDEVAVAIDAYLVSHGIHVYGARTITVNDKLCEKGEIYVDPSGFVMFEGVRWCGRGYKEY
jgi:hypothetical protein